jgi:DNA repair protein RadA/Sms
MAKLKTVYVCSNCGFSFPRWSGQCSNCSEWNTLVEDVIDPKAQSKMSSASIGPVTPLKITDVKSLDIDRIDCKIAEFNRVLGGGIVPGSVVLIGGEPGIGKSTLSLQFLAKLSQLESIVYLAGEESVLQISLRAKRLELNLDNVTFLETNLFEHFLSYADSNKINLLVVDSIQVIKSVEQSGITGGITQIRYITEKIVEFAKSKNIPVFLIGHVTKEGELAGPKVLEHLVDTVIYIEGDKINSYRFVKAIKNRFGATDEVGIFKMEQKGLIEVSDPTLEFIETREKSIVGASLSCIIEGNRPIMVEVQALVSKSNFGYPKRSATGFDGNRLSMLIAVLERHFGLDLSTFDVYINISGGFKIKDTASDLAIMQAIVSSYRKIGTKLDTVYLGEASLTGEIKKVPYQDLRESEIKRLGFKIVCSLKV